MSNPLYKVVLTTKNWKSLPIPFHQGVFQGDTMSPIMFLLAFNPLLQLAADLNCNHGYVIQLPLQHSEDLPLVDSTVYVKWVEQGDESPSWYQAIISEYFLDGFCQLVYDDTSNAIVSEMRSQPLFCRLDAMCKESQTIYPNRLYSKVIKK